MDLFGTAMVPEGGELDALDSRELKLGSRFCISQPKLQTIVWSVTELTPPHSFSWESRNLGISVTGRHTIDEISSVETRASGQIILSGPLSRFTAIAVGRRTQDYLTREAAALKQTVENAKFPSV